MSLNILIIAGVILLFIVSLGFIFSRLYHKSSKQVSFIRTGLGGEKVILNGGAIVLPILHDVISINMNTLKLEIKKNKEESLITKDRLRVDIVAEFYLRVSQNKSSIAIAAQTLGLKTINPESLKSLIEGKLVDALRTTAAEMDMDELHEQRSSFVQKVQLTVNEDLNKNGLELESVSLTGLDQTDIQYFNENNAFDAKGLKKLTETIEANKKSRNDIQQENLIAIEEKNLLTAQKIFAVEKSKEESRLEEERKTKIFAANQRASIIKEEEKSLKESEEAKILSQKAIELANIHKNEEIESTAIATNRKLAELEIKKEQAIKIAEQDKQIAISVKTEAEASANQVANEAKKLEIESLERIETAKSVEVEKRKAEVELINIENKAKIIEREAQANAKAIIEIAEANKIKMEIDAKGNSAINDAENILSNDILDYRAKLEFIKNLENIIIAMSKPMENIDSINIVDMKGLGGVGGNNGGDANSKGNNLGDDFVNAALKYKIHTPFVENMLKSIGIKNGLDSLQGMTNVFNDTPETLVETVADTPETLVETVADTVEDKLV